EALDMLQAMNTGHDGSLTTVHANSPRDVISRLETMVLMSGMDLPLRAIREQIASAIHVIVHESRFSDGTRKISRVSEIVGLEGDQLTMQDIFIFEQTGLSPEGRALGRLLPTGSVPTFVEDMSARGITINRRIFDPSEGAI
ncbi:MAG: Flp pilus assembly complex ATPase component TadA, partial [Kiritimatiellae bacterium]|nr:Flp pilus assembly complex ATPase component TadA [Kiritimatiellia bacterium]